MHDHAVRNLTCHFRQQMAYGGQEILWRTVLLFVGVKTASSTQGEASGIFSGLLVPRCPDGARGITLAHPRAVPTICMLKRFVMCGRICEPMPSTKRP
jgi:hypothetical protein